MVHQGLVLELALETTWVAKSIPRLDADEGSLFAERTPEGDDRRAEVESHLWLAVSTQQLCTMHLALVNLHAVVAPGVVCKLDDALLCFHRDLCHLVRAVDIALQTVEGLFVVKTDMAALGVASLHARHVEGRILQ